MNRILGAIAGAWTVPYMLFVIFDEQVTLVPNTKYEWAILGVFSFLGLVSVR